MLNFVKGDLLTFPADAIVHQVNCVSTTAKGLAKSVHNTYSYSDVYSRYPMRDGIREYGMAAVLYSYPDRKQGNEMKPVKFPVVVSFSAQICPGKPGDYVEYYKVDPALDTAEKRLEAFKTCLRLFKDELGCNNSSINLIKSVAFPDKIGCGLAGGDWRLYKAALEDFAKNVPSDVKVYVVELV